MECKKDLPQQVQLPELKLMKPMRHEAELYYHTALLWPPERSIKDSEPEIWELLHGDKPSKLVQRSSIIVEYLRKSWRTNVTLVDMEWTVATQGLAPDFAFWPFDLVTEFYDETNLEQPRNATRLYDYVAPFFIETAKAINYLDGRLSVEMILGDCTEVLERLQYGLLSHRNSESVPEHGERKALPTTFDRIHLSNIPSV